MVSMLRSSIEMSKQAALKKAKELASSAPVVVFRAKQLLTQVGATYKVIELDELSGGYELQSALGHWTGQSTVPNVFIEGKHIGGCDSVLEKHKNNQLLPLLNDAGAVAINSAQL
uniref:Glutaredoxin domain-containing protein n=1 Tax=Populus trichocarpa TaxID=3694 RepID=A0A2K1YAS3_POPTR